MAITKPLKAYPMCPHCGKVFKRQRLSSLIPEHNNEDSNGPCPGGGQIPRSDISDHRPLWNGKPNLHAR